MNKLTEEEIIEALILILASNEEIAQRLKPSEITEETSLTKDLGFDSYMFLEYLMEVEDKLDMQVDYSNITAVTIDTVKSFSHFLEFQMSKA